MSGFIQGICDRQTNIGIRPHSLLDILNSLGHVEQQAGYLVQLLCDVTSKASTAALNKLAFGVNMLGGHFAPWTCTLIPAESESEAAYSAAYAASKNATRAVMRLPLCEDDDCLTYHAAEPTQAWPSINQGIRGG